MLRRRTLPPWTRQIAPSEVFMAIAWIGMRSRSARPARKTSLFGKPALEAGRDEKARSVVALSRVPRLAEFAGSPPAAGLLRRLTGLLSGSPPTGTQPQARAKLGEIKNMQLAAHYKRFFKKSLASQIRMVKPYLLRRRRTRILSKLIATTKRRSPDAFIVIKVAAVAPAVVHQRCHPNRDGADTER